MKILLEGRNKRAVYESSNKGVNSMIEVFKFDENRKHGIGSSDGGAREGNFRQISLLIHSFDSMYRIGRAATYSLRLEL